jgi:hypothetical protein
MEPIGGRGGMFCHRVLMAVLYEIINANRRFRVDPNHSRC